MDTKAQVLTIGGRQLGGGAPCFVIAEAGVNHNGSLDLARQLIDVAADAGVDAVKFQTFIPEHVVSEVAPKADYQLRVTDSQESQLEMERRLVIPFDDFRLLKEHAAKRGLMFLSSPFDVASVTFLAELGVPALKIPSGELTHWALLRAAAATGLPLLLSTGMGNMAEIRAALEEIRAHGNPPIALFHCTSCYPTMPKDANLRAMATMRDELGCLVGYSDHTESHDVAVAAVALGAPFLEKHFTLDKGLEGPDHQASLDPDELKAMIQAVRAVEVALGDGVKRAQLAENNTALVARRSLFAFRHIAKGAVIAMDDVIALRPAGGIAANSLDEVLGATAAKDIPAGTMLERDDLC